MPIIASINKQSAFNHLELFPNTAKEVFNINFEQETSVELRIGLFNLNGTQIYSAAHGNKATGGQSNSINVENLKEGMYLQRINSKKKPPKAIN